MSNTNINHSKNSISNRTTMTARTKSKIIHSFKSSHVKLDKHSFSMVGTTTIKFIVKVTNNETHANNNINSSMHYSKLNFITCLSDQYCNYYNSFTVHKFDIETKMSTCAQVERCLDFAFIDIYLVIMMILVIIIIGNTN